MVIYLGICDGIMFEPILGNAICIDDGITLGTDEGSFDVETQ